MSCSYVQRAALVFGAVVIMSVAASVFVSYPKGVVMADGPHTPSCKGVSSTVSNRYHQKVSNSECGDSFDCSTSVLQCSDSPCAYCANGANESSLCGSDGSAPESTCHSHNTGCGYCWQGGTCDPVAYTCSGGSAVYFEGFPQICYIRNCH